MSKGATVAVVAKARAKRGCPLPPELHHQGDYQYRRRTLDEILCCCSSACFTTLRATYQACLDDLTRAVVAGGAPLAGRWIHRTRGDALDGHIALLLSCGLRAGLLMRVTRHLCHMQVKGCGRGGGSFA